MSSTKRSNQAYQTYIEALQKFDYFIVGVSIALVGYLAAALRPIVGRQDLIANPAVVGLTRSLYFDESRQNLKNNAVDSKAPPGSIRRLVAVLMQLDLTYDLHRMSEKDLFALLPQREFGPWMSAQSDPSPAGQAKLPNPDKVALPLTKANHR